MAVMGLGHFGYFVKDIEVMKDFWGNFMGMTLTKSSEGAAFYSADPKGVDHEIAIMQGRPEVSATAWKCTKTGKMKMWHFSGIKFATGLA